MFDFIKNWIISMRKKGGWKQGLFTPKFPDKCINVTNGKRVFARSSWETKMFNWCDLNQNVVKWGSEIIKIPYIYDIDKSRGIHKTHNYTPDLYCEIRNNKGYIDKYIIEIKPQKQKDKPIAPKRRTPKAVRNYYLALYEYVRNQNKWRYANLFCEGKNWKFKVITDDTLFRRTI